MKKVLLNMIGKSNASKMDAEELLKKIQAIGVEYDNYNSDLYIIKTPEVTKLLKNYEYPNNVTSFIGNDDRRAWYEIPFAFNPKTDKKWKGAKHSSHALGGFDKIAVDSILRHRSGTSKILDIKNPKGLERFIKNNQLFKHVRKELEVNLSAIVDALDATKAKSKTVELEEDVYAVEFQTEREGVVGYFQIAVVVYSDGSYNLQVRGAHHDRISKEDWREVLMSDMVEPKPFDKGASTSGVGKNVEDKMDTEKYEAFASKIKSAFTKHFPNGFFHIDLTKSQFGNSHYIDINIGLIGNDKDLPHGIRGNDPMRNHIMIEADPKGDFTNNTMTLTGDYKKLFFYKKPSPDSNLAMEKEKVNFTKTKGDLDKLEKTLKVAFKRLAVAVEGKTEEVYGFEDLNKKYFKISTSQATQSKAQLGKAIFEAKSAKQKEYQEFFRNLLEEFDVNSPAELSEEKKKEFFDKIKSDYKGGSSEAKMQGIQDPLGVVTMCDKATSTQSTSVKLSIKDYSDLLDDLLEDVNLYIPMKEKKGCKSLSWKSGTGFDVNLCYSKKGITDFVEIEKVEIISTTESEKPLIRTLSILSRYGLKKLVQMEGNSQSKHTTSSHANIEEKIMLESDFLLLENDLKTFAEMTKEGEGQNLNGANYIAFRLIGDSLEGSMELDIFFVNKGSEIAIQILRLEKTIKSIKPMVKLLEVLKKHGLEGYLYSWEGSKISN